MSINPYRNMKHAGDLSDEERDEILHTLERYMDYLRDEIDKSNTLPLTK